MPKTNKKLVFLLRIAIFLFFSFSSLIIIKHHFYDGPKELCSHSKNLKLKLDEHQNCLVPYLFYLPYSLIQMNFLGIPVFGIGIYAAIKDLIALREIRLKLVNILKLISENQFYYNHLDKDSCRKMKDNFENFAVQFIDKIGRYTYLVLGSGIIIAFEYWIGQHTLSNKAQTWTVVSHFLLFSIFALICAGFFFYEDAFNESYKILNKVGCHNCKHFESNYNVLKFLQRIFIRNLFLCVGLIILSITIIHMLFISRN